MTCLKTHWWYGHVYFVGQQTWHKINDHPHLFPKIFMASSPSYVEIWVVDGTKVATWVGLVQCASNSTWSLIGANRWIIENSCQKWEPSLE